jgi:hypothetical protein
MNSPEQDDFELLDADSDDGSLYEIVKVYRRRRRTRQSSTSDQPAPAEQAQAPPYPPYPPMPPYPPYPPYVIVTGGCSCGAASGGRGMGVGMPVAGGIFSGFSSVQNPTQGVGAPPTSLMTSMSPSSFGPGGGQPGPVPTPSTTSLLLDLADRAAALPGLLF